MTLYELKDGKMVEKCDDIPAELNNMEDKIDVDLPVPEPPEEAEEAFGSAGFPIPARSLTN